MPQNNDFLRVFAPAKINLSLHIGAPIVAGKYKNYHPLNSLVVFADFGDELYFNKSTKLELEFEGEFGAALAGVDVSTNLIVKAAKELNRICNSNHGAKIRLVKNLPIASGIGGGSTDCAATLLGLNELWELGLGTDDLAKIGEQLGADIPVCLFKAPRVMRDIGQIVDEAPILPKRISAIIANPLLDCATKLVYQKFDEIGAFPNDIDFSFRDCIDFNQFIEMIAQTQNNLTDAAIITLPQIGELMANLSRLEGVKFVRMSGSGATCFALFENDDDAISAHKKLIEIYRLNGAQLWARVCNFMGQ